MVGEPKLQPFYPDKTMEEKEGRSKWNWKKDQRSLIREAIPIKC